MSIPTRQDYALRDVENLAANVVVRLTTMRYAPKNTNRDVAGLREVLQQYVNAVMALAHEAEG
ncbi:hypothetical protein HL666_14850 [Bradyrhizobium sp. 83002]|uniref:hypothetical protein n=1 Tax=Bradyrhizobium aeschynomenes TaxID=2734909 RepID=UPI001553268B|nr:hypothetical protein [Bradyrhizobium aeschynomenes]NPU12048.1 hypothetical protein [Bradyrhizobium aeschynomenes]